MGAGEMSSATQIFDRSLIRRHRARAAQRAAEHDFLLQRVADDLAERVSIIRRDFPLAVDLSARPGVLSERLRALGNVGTVIDAAVPGADATGSSVDVIADEEALPFGDVQLDLVVSGLTLQLVNDLPGTLIQIRRALKPDGLLLAALLGGETLKELREAWLVAEEEICGGVSPRVAPFADVRELGSLLQRAGFALPVVDSDTVRVTYADPLALMREVKAMGGSNPLADRRRTPVTRGLLMRAAQVYQERFGLPGGRVQATFEIVTLTAWVPDASQPKPLRPGSAKVNLADVLGKKPR